MSNVEPTVLPQEQADVTPAAFASEKPTGDELGAGGLKALQAERQANKQLQSEIQQLSLKLQERQRQLEQSQKSLAEQYEEKTAIQVQQKEREIAQIKAEYESKVAELAEQLEMAEAYQRQLTAQQMITAITAEFDNEFRSLKPQYRDMVLNHLADGLTMVDGKPVYRLVDQSGQEQYYPVSALREFYENNYAEMFDAPPVVNGVTGIRDASRSSLPIGSTFVFDDSPSSKTAFLQNIEAIAKGQLKVKRVL